MKSVFGIIKTEFCSGERLGEEILSPLYVTRKDAKIRKNYLENKHSKQLQGSATSVYFDIKTFKVK